CMEKWGSTADYLKKKIPGKTFVIAPVSFNGVDHVFKYNEVHFFLGNSSMAVTAKVRYNASPVATLINSSPHKATTLLGGVIFTRKDNDKINSLADLKGKTIMGAKETSLGGWQAAHKEMFDAGIDPFKDLAGVVWAGTHDKVVSAVKFKAVDAGTVRTDTLERMADEGKINMDDFRIINKKDHKDFPFVCSTLLYPEWPLMKAAGTTEEIAREVSTALLEMRFTDIAAKQAKILGWREALDYQAVEELQKTLKVGAYKVEKQKEKAK
ncbi:MAG: phosphate/phosphite/phosphonate ABC transporter substrate-binding protein, partial [Candidatus Omnitrophica bacterium]|nr:phosphate/phosphite/phosphonate ABC transporter substrate-binding protein [Candidatus Omnitrophota bacterium]